MPFEQGGPWYSGNYRVYIHSKMVTWHAKNMQVLSHISGTYIYRDNILA